MALEVAEQAVAREDMVWLEVALLEMEGEGDASAGKSTVRAFAEMSRNASMAPAMHSS